MTELIGWNQRGQELNDVGIEEFFYRWIKSTEYQ